MKTILFALAATTVVSNAQSFAAFLNPSPTPGQLDGMLDGVGLTYSAPDDPASGGGLIALYNFDASSIVWSPAATTVDLANHRLTPSNTGTPHVLTFSSPVLDPVIHVTGIDSTSTLLFTDAFTYEAGTLTTKVGNTLTAQANGGTSASLKFSGVFNSLTWSHTATNLDGLAYTFSGSNAIPEPSGMALIGLGAIGFFLRRKR